jgi:uncharacterized protein YceK
MRSRATACLLSVLASALGGCGTVVNCVNGDGAAPRTIYGGVKQDAQNGSRHLAEAFSGPAPTLGQMPQPPDPGRDFLVKTFCAGCGIGMLAVDLPVSAVADTLTLPLTVPSTLMKKKNDPKKRRRPKAMGMPAAAGPPSRPSGS